MSRRRIGSSCRATCQPGSRIRGAGMALVWGLLLSCLWTARAACAAEPVRVPPLGPIERGEYRARDARTEEELWRTRWKLEARIREGATTIQVEEEGRGSQEGIGPAAWSVRIDAVFAGGDRRLSSRREIRNDAGRLVRVEERDLNYGSGSGRITVTDGGTSQKEIRQISLTPTSISAEMLAAHLRLLPDRDGRQARFDLITRDGKDVPVAASVVGTERVTVPAGTFECYKIEIDPTGFLGLLSDIFLPRIFMWHTVAAPHYWVKYQGPDEGRLSREIIRELVRFETHPGATP